MKKLLLCFILAFSVCLNAQADKKPPCESAEESAVPFYNPDLTAKELVKCLTMPAEHLIVPSPLNKKPEDYPKTSPIALLAQGGPLTSIKTLNGPLSRWKLPVPAFWIHQSQTLYPEIINSGKLLSPEEAAFAFKLSIAIFQKTIEHFKQPLNETGASREVYVLSHSLGSLIFQALIGEFSDSPYKADKAVITAGRLAFPELFIRAFQQGRGAEFTALNYKDFKPEPLPIKKHSIKEKNTMAVLAAAAGYSYMEALEQSSLNDVLYISANKDFSLGPLSGDEKDFLAKRGARVFSFEGLHNLIAYEASEDPYLAIKEFLFENTGAAENSNSNSGKRPIRP